MNNELSTKLKFKEKYMSDSKEQDGKWIYKKWCCFECSNCGFKIDQYKMHLPPDLYPYCPMCGQKNIVN